MVRGLSVKDETLAEACYDQACFDFLNGEELFEANSLGSNALAAAQFQQCCEKALKAILLLEVGRSIYGQKVKISHRVWTEDLNDGRLAPVRKKIQSFLGILTDQQIEASLSELEGFAPLKIWIQANTEYPWVDVNGKVHTTARFFDSQEAKVRNFLKLSRLILSKVKDHSTVSIRKRWDELIRERNLRRATSKAD